MTQNIHKKNISLADNHRERITFKSSTQFTDKNLVLLSTLLWTTLLFKFY